MKILHTLLVGVAVAAPSLAQDTVMVSQGPLGQANAPCASVRMSADAGVVVFNTLATNLVPGDTNPSTDVVLWNRGSGALELISKTPTGQASISDCFGPTVSADGRFVAFVSLGPGVLPGFGAGVFLHDRSTGTTVSASGVALDDATRPQVSPDGRYVVYGTDAALDPSDTNGSRDIYRFDRITQSIDLVSADGSGVQSTGDASQATISSGGRYVSFDSWSTTWGAGFSAFPHMWVKDMVTGELQGISTEADGTPLDGPSFRGTISADGRYAVFETFSATVFGADGFLQIGRKDLATGEIVLCSQNDAGVNANSPSVGATLSADGRFALFGSSATNLHASAPGFQGGLFVRDLVEGTTRLVSLSSAATGHVPGNNSSFAGSISITGQHVAFGSIATNLSTDDLNGILEDVFVRDRFGDQVVEYGQSGPQTLGCVPTMEAVGTPSAGAGSGFALQLRDTRGAQPGLLVYSRTGASAKPFLGSFLYVAPPLVRTAPQFSGGTPGQCDGGFSFDFNTWLGSGSDPNLTAGSTVWAQYWTRNPGGPDGAYLSNAVRFVLAP